jgi:peptidyl-prolyl cis-trans isomerase B (cyclophilin B)
MRKLTYLVLFFLLVQAAVAQKKSKKDYLVTITTEYGTLYAVLYDDTPKHKANFIALADTGFYNGTLFHRIINGFMIQGGDPNSKKAAPGEPLGNGDVGYQVPAEFNEKRFHKKGVLAAARDNNPAKASSGCQFYIVQGKVLRDEDFATAERRSGRTIPADQRQCTNRSAARRTWTRTTRCSGNVIKGAEVDRYHCLASPRQLRPSAERHPMQVKVEK